MTSGIVLRAGRLIGSSVQLPMEIAAHQHW